MHLSPQEIEKIRLDFREFVERGIWQGEDEYTKNFAVGNLEDWWIDRIKLLVNPTNKR